MVFLWVFIWEKKEKPSFLNTNMGTIIDHILVYEESTIIPPLCRCG